MLLTFLGTSAGLPSLDRGLPSLVLKYGREILMFDCGEGTQRQMMRARIGFSRPMKIFVTHLHGDHMLGIPGLLQTMSLLGRTEKIQVYGPKGLADFLEAARTHVKFLLRFPLEVFEVEEGLICREKAYKVTARWTEHQIPTLAYAFEEKEKPGKFHPEKALSLGVPKGPLWHRLQHGRRVRLKDGRTVEPSQVVGPPRRGVKIVYSGDGKPCPNVLKLARNADLLVHECTFDDSLKDKAEAEWHSTAGQAAVLASKARAKRLILTHISTRYRDSKLLLEQARKEFSHVKVAEDFMQIEL
ncbi:ribonuclease Z [Candidatus Hecatella orcuttiae]|uniref:ribonuclease Z n=1 Tax=Candidatus Hecatella orcuttiae TaxID=1935119 RepID=UPI0028682007|nr:ribonuclease Z [Candidatus Hecatella orcuttiae]